MSYKLCHGDLIIILKFIGLIIANKSLIDLSLDLDLYMHKDKFSDQCVDLLDRFTNKNFYVYVYTYTYTDTYTWTHISTYTRMISAGKGNGLYSSISFCCRLNCILRASSSMLSAPWSKRATFSFLHRARSLSRIQPSLSLSFEAVPAACISSV